MQAKTERIFNDYNIWLGRQIFSDAEFKGRVTFSGGTPVFDVRGFGAKGDDVTDDTAQINKAAAAMVTATATGIRGARLYFPSGTYKITDNILITVPCIIDGDGTNSLIKQYTDAKTVFTISSSDVYIRDLKLTGNGSDAYSAGARAIYAYGADASNYLANIFVDNVVINSWKDSGIYLSFVKQFGVKDCNVQAIAGHGIIGMSVADGFIHHNYVENMTCKLTASNGYGIVLTKTVGATATYPTPKRVIINDNYIRQCPWEALDCHSGDHLTFSYNQIYNCEYGMVVGTANDGAGTYYPATNILVNGNLIDSEVADGTAKTGIEFASTSATAINTGSIIGNIIKGHGDVTSSPANEGTAGGIVAFRTRNLVIEGNRLLNCSSSGIDLVRDNGNFICNGNSIDDPWGLTTQQNACWGIYSGTSGGNDGLIVANSISRGAFAIANGVYLDTVGKGFGVTIGNAAGTETAYGHNHNRESDTALSDVGAYTY